MTFDPSTLSFKDGILVGILIGQWLNARGRRDQGKRLGRVEKIVAKHLGLDDGDDDDKRKGTP